jgi:hypothetical protein
MSTVLGSTSQRYRALGRPTSEQHLRTDAHRHFKLQLLGCTGMLLPCYHLPVPHICEQVLPIDEQEKAKLLPIRSARLRLRLVVHWIEQLNNNWWFSSGCVVG